MALKLTVKTEQGFEATDAYHRVEGIRLDNKNSISFQTRSYKDAFGVPHFSDKKYACEYDLSGNNPIAQAYMYLKTLPEFAGAKDC